jgi:hypothetical protein
VAKKINNSSAFVKFSWEPFYQNGFATRRTELKARSKWCTCTKPYLVCFILLACCIQNWPNSYPLYINALISLAYMSYSNNGAASKIRDVAVLTNSDIIWLILSDFQACVTLMNWDICSEWDTWTQTWTLRVPKRKQGRDLSRCGRTLRKLGTYRSHLNYHSINVTLFSRFKLYNTDIFYYF